MKGFFKGVATALITPFSENGVNFHTLEELIERQIAAGASAVVILGTTGEPAAMTEEEREQALRFAVRRVNGRIKVIAGAGSNCTANAVSAAKMCEDAGADGLLAVTPYYNKCTQKGLVAYYEAIANASRLPLIAYNVPSRTGVNILPETMARIAEIPSVAGIKEASGNMAQVMEISRLIRGKCDLYSGEDALNLPVLAAGGAGVISVVSNLAPRRVKALCDAVFAGRLSQAQAISDSLLPLTKACFTEVNPIPVKEGMNLLGYDAGLPRAPLTPLEEGNRRILQEALAALNTEVHA